MLGTSIQQQLDEQGFVVIPGLYPPAMMAQGTQALWSFLNLAPDTEPDWSQLHLPPHGFLPFYHHPSLWQNRTYPPLWHLYSQLLGTSQLWVSLDRVMLKPPAPLSPATHLQKPFLHIDVNLTRAQLDQGTDISTIPRIIQGIIALTDTTPEQGAFHCLAGAHRDLSFWNTVDWQGNTPITGQLDNLPLTVVPCQAGDVILFYNTLPHGSGPNKTRLPRLAQYVNMTPALETQEPLRQARIQSWKNSLAPPGFPDTDSGCFQGHYPEVPLSTLGRKLLGLDFYHPTRQLKHRLEPILCWPGRWLQAARPFLGNWR